MISPSLPVYLALKQISSSLSSQSDLISPWPLSPNLITQSDPISAHHLLTPKSSSKSFYSTASTLTNPKRRCLPFYSRNTLRQQNTPTNSSATSTTHLPNLTACHICHRRPTAHAELSEFLSCELCEQRICNICIRVCEAEGCHSNAEFRKSVDESDRERRYPLSDRAGSRGKAVCKRCCKEVGPEGNVWCLVCFEDDGEEDPRGRDSGDDDGEEVNRDEAGRVEQWLDSFNG